MSQSLAASLDRASKVPLWRQLYDDVRRRIESGELLDAMPGEVGLAEGYGVSRHTAREALRRLRSEGLIVAGRGQRPRVVSPKQIKQPLSSLYSLFASVEAAGLEQRSLVLRSDVHADAVISDFLGLDDSSPLFFLERLRLADGEPLALDRVWLPLRVASPLLGVDFGRTSLYRELSDRCGAKITGASEKIRAVVPTAGQRRLLQMPDEAACLAINRLGTWDGQPVEWRTTLIRGDRFVLSSELSSSTSRKFVWTAHGHA